MSRRDEIAMDAEELLTFLDEQRVVTCATLGRDGRAHLMPLWYVVRETSRVTWDHRKLRGGY